MVSSGAGLTAAKSSFSARESSYRPSARLNEHGQPGTASVAAILANVEPSSTQRICETRHSPLTQDQDAAQHSATSQSRERHRNVRAEADEVRHHTKNQRNGPGPRLGTG